MRRILLALMALACVAPAAEASTREQRTSAAASTSQSSSTQTTASRTASRPTGTQASNLRPGDVRTSSGGVLVRGASAATVSREAPAARPTQATARNAVANCTPTAGRTACAPARSSVAGWQSGLPRADYAQRDCPEGTLATLARGHEDVVRCMPF
jgi:flagellar capping protein FliD